MLANDGRGLDGLTVLIVEDNADARDVFAYWLQSQGVKVHAADSARAALAILAMHTPDVMVSDIVMPDENGYELMRRVRSLQHAKKRCVPAIAFTTCSLERERNRALEVGFDLHLVKPVEPRALAEAVLTLVQRAGPGGRHDSLPRSPA